MTKKIKIVVDGRELEVDSSTNVLQAVLGKGHNLPYFCWHPALGSVGACRQCGVMQYKDEQDTQGRLVMSCMTPCTPWARFSIDHPDARDMRAAVVEFLMTNHPHDCPVCEEGGHCHLQDMTVMTGHNYRRYRHTKRTHRNQDLGPFVNHEMNRCIACYRCVRYYKDYAGGKDLDNFGSASNVYFGRAEDGVLESEFSGNLVEVCPTGVFTDKPYGESYTRKWDLQTAPSICAHCSIGCNTSPGERYGSLKRIENRYHGEINGYFICDRGRFGYGYVNRDDRPRTPLIRAEQILSPPSPAPSGHPLPKGEGSGNLASPSGRDAFPARGKGCGEAAGEGVVTAEQAVSHVAGLLKQGRVIGIGSPRASLETNFALQTLVGKENFHLGQPAADAEATALGIEILRNGPAKIASIREAEQADAVLVLGEDVLNTGARLALALRQSTRQAGFKLAAAAHIPQWQDSSVRTLTQDVKSPLFIATPAATGLDEISAGTFRAGPAGIARLGMAVAHALDNAAPVVPNLDATTLAMAAKIAQALLAAERPLIVSGASLGSPAVLQAAANVAGALVKAGRTPSISLVFAEANSVGAGLLGGQPLEAALKRMETGEVDTVLVAENDLTRRISGTRLDAALAKVKHLVVLDHLTTPTVQRAGLVLSAGSFAESDGTLVNNEGRAQRYFQVFVPQTVEDEEIRESWRWLQDIAIVAQRDGLGVTLDELIGACAQAVPALAGIVNAAPNAKFRMAGARIPRQPHRYSGRTAMNAKLDVHEPQPLKDVDTPLAFSMEGATGLGTKPAALIPMFWAPNWNSPQAVNKFQAEIGGALKNGDPGVQLFARAPLPLPPPTGGGGFLTSPPAGEVARSAGEGILQAVALHHLFGSEELSGQAPVMASRIPGAYLALNPATAAKARLKDGAAARLSYNGSAVTLPVKIKPELPDNCVGVPVGLAGVPAIEPGIAVKVSAA